MSEIGGELTYGKNFQKSSFGTNVPLSLNKNIYIAKVVSIDDDNNTGRIKVFISGIDQSKTPIDSLPYVYPLMSRIVHVMPKIGEAVLVFFADAKKEKESQILSNRFWIGPIITNIIGKDMCIVRDGSFDIVKGFVDQVFTIGFLIMSYFFFKRSANGIIDFNDDDDVDDNDENDDDEDDDDDENDDDNDDDENPIPRRRRRCCNGRGAASTRRPPPPMLQLE